MTDTEKQEYMNALFNRIQHTARRRENDAILLPALIGNYESKLRIGWPAANNIKN